MQNRRKFVGCAIAGLTAAAGSTWNMNASLPAASPAKSDELSGSTEWPVRYCLNTSTIHGQEIDVVQQIEIAATAGYDGIELWLRDVAKYQQSGGNLVDLRNRIADSGLRVESAIAFANWIVDDDSKRAAAMSEAARDMDIVRRLGGRRIAAPPAGATDSEPLNLDRVAERYYALCELGRKLDCVPQLEVWGFSSNLSTLSEVLYVLAACQHPDACVLPDVYHLYKGGSDFLDLPLVAGAKMHCFHMNDYPAQPGRAEINDAARVYPTDGVAPLEFIMRTLRRNGFVGALSLELFNREYWKQDPAIVAANGLAKMRAAVDLAMESQM